MSDPWWPDGYTNPAFQVQRQIYGVATGGDYVRGSGVVTLPSTALRYPTQPVGYDEVRNKAFLSVRAFDYVTAEIGWGWPIDLEDKWLEVALVRSGFGDPITVNDGVTIFRALKTDFVDGSTVTPPPLVYDQPLQSGQWYYYTLFFRTTPLDWIGGMTGNALIPRDHGHAQHLWNMIPPFYQHTDSNLREGNGPLRSFLAVFGFELDQTREYVEAWQDVYHIDKCPLPLLKQLGANLGEPYRGSIGAIRYRGYIAGLPEMLEQRGTPAALQFVVEAVSKYQCDISVGGNMMLLPDDSDFFFGTGSWSSLHQESDALASTVSTVAPEKVTLATVSGEVPPAGSGRGVMRVTTADADETKPLTIACGCGLIEDREIIPLYAAVPVQDNYTYGFSIQVRQQTPNTAICKPVLLWYKVGGTPSDYFDITEGTATAPPNANWNPYSVQGTSPAGAYYVVPALSFTSRPAGGAPGLSPYIDLAGASVYVLGSQGQVSVLPPDSYLTLGDPSEKLGPPNLPTFPGYRMGQP